jgi:putative protease
VLNPNQAGGTGIYLGKVAKTKPGFAALESGRYEPEEGDSIRLHKKDDSLRTSHKIKSIERSKDTFWVDIPAGFSQGDNIYLIQTKSMAKRYPHIIPEGAHGSRPPRKTEALPILDLTIPSKNALASFPEGIYVQVSTLRDMAVVQSEHPVRAILELNAESKASLVKNNAALPLSKKQIFLALEPFCPEAEEKQLAELVDALTEQGYKNWIVNNPAHISMLRGKDVFLAAGPYLYTFNRWAASWLENQNVQAFVSPLENSRANLEATFEKNVRSRVLVPLFAYPALFRMRFRLPQSYDFTYFSDKKEAVFKTLVTPDGSFVLPENPFSILDAASQLKHSGFSRFLIDLSKTGVQKKHLKQIMAALYKGEALPHTVRFNWNDGFFAQQQVIKRANKSADKPAARAVTRMR